MLPEVDLVVLSRTSEPLHAEVEQGVRAQSDVRAFSHRIEGRQRPTDGSRCETIARARNDGKRRGSAAWLMFLDDDVVLEPGAIAALIRELQRRPVFGALASDYLGEHRNGQIARHVTMGATLFRREALRQISFRSLEARCECQCCCDDLRRLHWAIDYLPAAKSRHLSNRRSAERAAATHAFARAPLVSCMCVTRDRVPLLRRSIQCFLNQTYPQRELIVVYESDDNATKQYLAELNEPSIIAKEAAREPRLTLGALRNIALRSGAGKYVAQWDDDDWYSPERLTAQLRAIQESGKRGCVLSRWTLHDELTKQAYVSHARPWEGSLVAERAALPLYPDLAKREDTPVVEELVRRGALCLLDRPELYVYTHHGANTWDRAHWQKIIDSSRPLSQDSSELITALLGVELHGMAPCHALLSSRIRAAIPPRAQHALFPGPNSAALHEVGRRLAASRVAGF